MKKFVEIFAPAILGDGTIENQGKRAIKISKIIAKGCTLGTIKRNEEGQGSVVDSSEKERIVNFILCNGEKWSFTPNVVFVDGKQQKTFLELRKTNFNPFKNVEWSIVVTPLEK